MAKGKVQPHCMICTKHLKRDDSVYTNTLYTQIQHVECFIYKPEYIKDTGTYEEIVNKYPRYKMSFIVSDKPLTSLLVKSENNN